LLLSYKDTLISAPPLAGTAVSSRPAPVGY